jgi:mannose-6-phosphate isomerase-like protein (cupin superfamily)
MALRCKRIWIESGLLFLFLVLLACAPSPRFYLQYGGSFSESDLDRILAANSLPATENIRVTTLGQAQEVSHHIVQVRDREPPHIHRERDATVILLRGQGYLLLDGRRIDLKVGDVLFIPRRAVHYFVNTFSEPSVALAVFSPPFDGKDTVPVEKP